MKIIKYKSGFTFLELIITISIIGIMAVVSLSYVGQNRTDKEVEAASREVTSALREAQNDALSGKNAKTCTSHMFNYSGSSYSIGCAGSLTSYNLKNGVTFQGNGSVSFSIPFANVSNAASIKLQKSGVCYQVSVSAAGVILESKC